MLANLEIFGQHAERQIDQIRRRAASGRNDSAGNEKVFSWFEAHTEWVSKGKAGVPLELGLRVCILADSRGFILHSQVMPKLTDDKVAVALIQAAPARFSGLNACSFDTGLHSPSNQPELKDRLDHVVLPKQGQCSKAEQKRESAPEFKRARQQHSAVESAINALEVHGLDSWQDSRHRRFPALCGQGLCCRATFNNALRLSAARKDSGWLKSSNKPPDADDRQNNRALAGEVCLKFDVSKNYSHYARIS